MHKMKIGLFMSLLSLFIISGNALAGSALEQSGKGLKIWFDTGGPVGGSYNTVVQNGAKQAAVDLGCDIEFLYSDWSPQKMIENFQKAIAAAPDGIVVMGHPGDSAYAPFIKEATDKGIIVTNTDTPLPEQIKQYQPDGFGYVGINNYDRGKALATEAIRRFDLKKGDRALVWGLKSRPLRGDSSKALIEFFEKGGLTVDYMEITPEIDKDASLGTPVITAYLSSHPDCDIIVTSHGALTAQLENFFRAAGVKPDEVIGAGFSLSPATAAAIESGYVDLVGDGQPYLQGYLPVMQIVLSKRFGFSGLNINTGAGFVHAGNVNLIAPLAKKGIR